MQVLLMRLMSKGEYLIVPKGTKFMGSGKLGLSKSVIRVLINLVLHVEFFAQPKEKFQNIFTSLN